MDVNFEEKFKEILKKESEEFDIDWSLVQIEFYSPNFMQMPTEPMQSNKCDEYMIRMVINEVNMEDATDDINQWFRCYKFTYNMSSKSIRSKFTGDLDMNYGQTGTIKSIAEKIRDIFKHFHEE